MIMMSQRKFSLVCSGKIYCRDTDHYRPAFAGGGGGGGGGGEMAKRQK